MRPPRLFFELPKKFGHIVTVQGGGSIIAAAISLLSTPIITRLYTPSEYAVLGIYLLAITFAIPISTLRYEVAILLPKTIVSAVTVAALCLAAATVFAFLTLAVIAIAPDFLPTILGNEDISWRQFFIPIGILIVALFQAVQKLALRLGLYYPLAFARVVSVALTSLLAILAGFVELDPAFLIVAQLAGGASAVALLAFSIRRSIWRISLAASTPPRLLNQATRYIRFPAMSLPGDFIGLLAVQGHLLAVSFIFGPAVFGALALGQRVIGTIGSVASEGLGQVFRREAARMNVQTGSFRDIYISTLLWLSLIAAVVYIPIALVAPPLFEFVFGDEWRLSGVYVSVMAPYFAFQFVGGILGYSTYIAERQDLDLAFQSLMAVGTAIAAFVGYATQSLMSFLICMNVIMCIIYVLYIAACLKISRGGKLIG